MKNGSVYYDEEDIIHVAGQVFTGGFDTVRSGLLLWIFSHVTVLQATMTLSTFLLVLVLHPEIQKKAQAEIDQMLKGALPTFEDQESLPYVTAVFKEALRWKPVAPLG